VKQTTGHELNTDNTEQQKNCNRKIVFRTDFTEQTASRLVLTAPSSAQKTSAAGNLPAHPPGCTPALPHPEQRAQ